MNVIDEFIEWVSKRGWTVARTNRGHLRLTRPGMPMIFGSGTPSDHRSIKNMRAKVKRVERATKSSSRAT